MIKVGAKIGDRLPEKYFEKIGQIVDFFEIYGDMSFDYDFLNNVDKPIVVHAPHSSTGVNLCNPGKKMINIQALNWSKKMADRFNAEKIIVHPEMTESSECTIDYLISFLKDNFDERFEIENMPYLADRSHRLLCSEPRDIKRVMDETKVKFCLDLAHAAEYAKGMEYNVTDFMNDLLSLHPSHYHISDSILERVQNLTLDDVHLSLFKGTIDLEMIKQIIPEGACVTLETPHNLQAQINEINFLKSRVSQK